MRSCAIHVHKHSVEGMLLQQCRAVTTVILSITPWLPSYMGQSLIRCNRNLELLLLLTPLDRIQILHDQKAFRLPHPFLLAMSQKALQGTIPGTPIAVVAAGQRV